MRVWELWDRKAATAETTWLVPSKQHKCHCSGCWNGRGIKALSVTSDPNRTSKPSVNVLSAAFSSLSQFRNSFGNNPKITAAQLSQNMFFLGEIHSPCSKSRQDRARTSEVQNPTSFPHSTVSPWLYWHAHLQPIPRRKQGLTPNKLLQDGAYFPYGTEQLTNA